MNVHLGQRIEAVFDEQSAAHPQRVAVEYGGCSVTYGELSWRADRLAAELLARGVERGSRVAITTTRSVHLAAGLLGILRAGAAYVPLDPDLPTERLEYMKEDAELDYLVTHSAAPGNHALRKVFEGATVLSVEGARESLSGAVRGADLNSSDVAYVMYTSGSTGTPKGVEVRHDGVVRLVDSPNYVELNDETVMLQVSPLSFDASTFEIWGALLNGGRLVSYANSHFSLDVLRGLLETHGINTMFLTARMFDRFVQARKPEPCHLAFVLSGGEVAAPASVERFYELYGDCSLLHVYGPTEATTFTTCYRVPRGVRFAGSVPIGVPINSTDVYILDEDGQLASPGKAGELWIGGPGLAKGYLRRPDLTAERFTTRACSRVPGELLYRTGDMARWLPDGNLEFLGRHDNQVKVAGYRVELGEVEHAMAGMPGVQSCAVTAIPDQAGDTRLVAFMTPSLGSTDPPESDHRRLRTLLATVLPVYMIPSAFVWLDQLPLNENGKVDKRELLSLLHARPADPAASESDLEGIVADAWRRVLDLPQVGIDDDFWALGGDSLRVVSLSLILEERLGMPVDIASTQGALTIRSLCKSMAEGINDNRTSCLIDFSYKSDTLLICFTGGGRELMMPPFDFLLSIQGLAAKRMLLRDSDRAFYHHGVEGYSHDIETTRAFLDREISRAGARRVVMLGTSMGGYAALLYGLLCRVDMVHAFAPITALAPEMCGYDAPGRTAWRDVFPTLDRQYFDLAALHREATTVPYCHLYAGSGNVFDVQEAERLRDCRNVRLNYLPTDEHNIARYMQRRGELASILKDVSEGMAFTKANRG